MNFLHFTFYLFDLLVINTHIWWLGLGRLNIFLIHWILLVYLIYKPVVELGDSSVGRYFASIGLALIEPQFLYKFVTQILGRSVKCFLHRFTQLPTAVQFRLNRIRITYHFTFNCGLTILTIFMFAMIILLNQHHW